MGIGTRQLCRVYTSWRYTYGGVLERLLSTRLVYADVRASMHINFDYLNRQLIWSEATGFILFVLPLVHVEPVGRLVNTYLPMNESIHQGGVDNCS